jgi:PTH1 family peptidyl-tRNA hydrolase
MVVDELAARVGGRFTAGRNRAADLVETRVDGTPVVLAKPRGYMNEAGGPVARLRSYFKGELSRLVVVHDELDLDFGRLRIKQGGGENGHNGLRSITTSLGSRDYHRVRFGIGRPPGRMDPADFVLHDFTAAERADLPVLLDRAADAVATLVTEGLAAAQNSFNN